MSEVLEKSRVQEVAEDLVAMCKAGQFDESGEKYWADDTMDVTPREAERMSMDEVGVYTVRNGRIVKERFFY